jgi:hypothetical protein
MSNKTQYYVMMGWRIPLFKARIFIKDENRTLDIIPNQAFIDAVKPLRLPENPWCNGAHFYAALPWRAGNRYFSFGLLLDHSDTSPDALFNAEPSSVWYSLHGTAGRSHAEKNICMSARIEELHGLEPWCDAMRILLSSTPEMNAYLQDMAKRREINRIGTWLGLTDDLFGEPHMIYGRYDSRPAGQ